MKMLEQELYIIRHGETDYNKNEIIQGRGVNSSINANGIKQALAFYDYYKNIPFHHIFTSCLKRTQETIQPFIKVGYTYRAFRELDEIDWGIHEGKPSTAIRKMQYNEITGKWRDGEVGLCIENGESPLKMQQRQKRFIENILKYSSGRILICTHGRAMRSLLCTLLGKPLSLMDTFPHKNLSLYKLIRHNDKYELKLFNYTAHLYKPIES